jgi:hypothetical protein
MQLHAVFSCRDLLQALHVCLVGLPHVLQLLLMLSLTSL